MTLCSIDLFPANPIRQLRGFFSRVLAPLSHNKGQERNSPPGCSAGRSDLLPHVSHSASASRLGALARGFPDTTLALHSTRTGRESPMEPTAAVAYIAASLRITRCLGLAEMSITATCTA